MRHRCAELAARRPELEPYQIYEDNRRRQTNWQPNCNPPALMTVRPWRREFIAWGLFGAALAFGLCTAAADVTVEQLRCEYLDNPLGIDTPQPRLSWVLESKQRGQKQTAYQILVASTEALLKSDTGDLWDTGTVASDQTLQVVYAGKALSSCQRCYWKVRVWDKDGKASDYSRPACWEMGPLSPQDWQGQWIAPHDGY